MEKLKQKRKNSREKQQKIKNKNSFSDWKIIGPKNKASEAAKNMEKVSRSYNLPKRERLALPESKAEVSQTKTAAPQLISKADLGILTLPFWSADKIKKKAVNKIPPKKRIAFPEATGAIARGTAKIGIRKTSA